MTKAMIKNEETEELLATAWQGFARQKPDREDYPSKYFKPNMIAEYIKQLDEREKTLIRGYEVVVQTAPSDPENVAYREMQLKNIRGEI